MSAHARHATTGSVAVSTGSDRSSVGRVMARYGAGSAGSRTGRGSGAGIVSGNGSDTGSTSMMRLG